ncbi:hypothetical protein CFI00_05605 [Nocardioides sp. S5]|nr:hypothetical protein CFI00_05605 [Nocardioides sp. S5]
MLSRGELVVIHPRVYVDHSGTPTRRQLEWAAVLACAPAALHRESALDAHGMTRDPARPRRGRIDRSTSSSTGTVGSSRPRGSGSSG